MRRCKWSSKQIRRLPGWAARANIPSPVLRKFDTYLMHCGKLWIVDGRMDGVEWHVCLFWLFCISMRLLEQTNEWARPARVSPSQLHACQQCHLHPALKGQSFRMKRSNPISWGISDSRKLNSRRRGVEGLIWPSRADRFPPISLRQIYIPTLGRAPWGHYATGDNRRTHNPFRWNWGMRKAEWAWYWDHRPIVIYLTTSFSIPSSCSLSFCW